MNYTNILYILSGLPGVGKTSIAKSISTILKATYIRIDTIEQGLRDLCDFDVQGEGYRLAYRLIADNLKVGNSVVVDSCNPWKLTRTEYENIAIENNREYINIEVICSDIAEHRKRIEERMTDIPNLKLPCWSDVLNRDYEQWDKEHILIDTAGKNVDECVNELVDKIKNEQNYILSTDRMFLRKLCETDFDDLCEILQDKETMYTYEHTLSDEEVKGWYDKQIDRYKKDGFGLWAVIHKDADDFLGVCGLTIQNINEIEYLEIGYMFKKKYWHCGYATEAAIGCKRYAKNVLKAEKVYSIMRDNNIPSQNVATRVGMIKTGEVIKHYCNMDMLHFVFEIELSKM